MYNVQNSDSYINIPPSQTYSVMLINFDDQTESDDFIMATI
jgi:hypothetical protein